jgi:hypothetical protein
MSTLKPRVRAYNLTPGQTVTIVGALRNETKTAPLDWQIVGITDHDGDSRTYLSPIGVRQVTVPRRRTLTLRPANGGTYLYTVDRDAHVTLASA